jgi:hypothetical protein
MAKYIDAERFKELLDAKYEEFTEKAKKIRSSHYQYLADGLDIAEQLIDSLQQEQLDVDLEKFTEKMDAWKARYNYPDNFSIKATMAFTARMFYMYPNVAREWYDSLPKVTLD